MYATVVPLMLHACQQQHVCTAELCPPGCALRCCIQYAKVCKGRTSDQMLTTVPGLTPLLPGGLEPGRWRLTPLEPAWEAVVDLDCRSSARLPAVLPWLCMELDAVALCLGAWNGVGAVAAPEFTAPGTSCTPCKSWACRLNMYLTNLRSLFIGQVDCMELNTIQPGCDG